MKPAPAVLVKNLPRITRIAQILGKSASIRVIRGSFYLTRERYLAALKDGLLFAVRDAAGGNVGSVNIRTDQLKPEPPPVPATPKPSPTAEE